MPVPDFTEFLVPGHFDRAFDAFHGSVIIPWQSSYGDGPVTVEMWVKIIKLRRETLLARYELSGSAHGFWIILGSNGEIIVDLPGRHDRWLNTKCNLADKQWHHVAVVIEPNLVQAFVDGKPCGQEKGVPVPGVARLPGPLVLGTLTDIKIPNFNLIHIEALRLSRGVREVTPVPQKPWENDADTLGLWQLDKLRPDGLLPDLSAAQNHGQVQEISHESMDEYDRREFNAGPRPIDTTAKNITLQPGRAEHPAAVTELPLDGTWELAQNGGPLERIDKPWIDAIPAIVPGSVHTALEKAGKIPDPKFGRYDALAREKSFQTWWYKREFARPTGTRNETLVFSGVAIHCTVWLNGTLLGQHEGMFGGPEFQVGHLLKDQNTLLVRIDPAPFSTPFFNGDNSGWKSTVVFNNVYGWHYSDIPALGIWQSVKLRGDPVVRIKRTLVATRDLKTGQISMVVGLASSYQRWQGTLVGTIEPENFSGTPVSFSIPVESTQAAQELHLSCQIPDPHIWWPNDLGEPHLYRLQLTFVPVDGPADSHQTTFGLRTIEMAPLTIGTYSKLYNWTFVINGQKHFMKGNGWCTMDSSMDFSRARYERFLTLADQQHVQLIRAWGSGMPETDEFYDLCDRLGIMVMQEWPTAWNSDREQPYEVLEETIRLNTLRIRNHPSLIMYGGGNESGDPFSPAIDMMGRYATELDGTRPFHRGEPWGGSDHNYDCWWGKAHLDFNLNMTSYFYGEFGIAALPVYESVQRYLPDNEKHVWPAPEGGSFQHHTPVFNRAEDVARLKQYSEYFTAGKSLQRFIVGSQLSQVVGLRHPLERARTRWPECTGALYYKMNDNYPAASWATADWYGAPKLAHYFCQDAFAPLQAVVLFESVNNQGKALSLPVFLLDDAQTLQNSSWKVLVRAFDGQLQPITQQAWEGKSNTDPVHRLGEFALTAQQTATAPLFVVTEVFKAGKQIGRSFYFLNFEAAKDSLFDLPRTTLSLQVQEGKAIVTNTGKLPAVAVAVLRPNHLDTFTSSDNYFWLEPGETETLEVNSTRGLMVEAWNSENRNW